MIKVLIYAILASLLFYALKLSRQGRQKQGLANLLSGISCLGIMTTAMISVFGSGKADTSSDQKLEEIRWQVVGQELSKLKSGGNVLIISDVLSAEKRALLEDVLIPRLITGLGDGYSFKTIAIPRSLEEFEAGEKPDVIFSGSELEEIFEENSDCSIVISIIGLPKKEELIKTRLLQGLVEDEDGYIDENFDANKLPALALIGNPMINNKLSSLIMYERIDLISRFNPSIKRGRKPPKIPEDLDLAYALRFLSITPKNLKELSKKYPTRRRRGSSSNSGMFLRD